MMMGSASRVASRATPADLKFTSTINPRQGVHKGHYLLSSMKITNRLQKYQSQIVYCRCHFCFLVLSYNIIIHIADISIKNLQ